MVLVADRAERLDRFLVRMLPEHSRTKLAKWIAEGEVLVRGRAAKPSLMLEPGWLVELEEPEESGAHDLTPADIPLDIRYEDEALLVVNKPRGLATHPAPSLREPSLVNALLFRGGALSQAAGSFRPGIVHRLDKDTTGLLVVAKTDAAHVALARQMEAKTAQRRYVAVVAGDLERDRLTVNAPLARDPRDRTRMAVDPNGRPAVTHVRRLARVEAGTLVLCQLETGRTHQIRVHLRAIGHPVVGDSLYAPRERAIGPLQLHAGFLAFDHPDDGRKLAVVALPPPDFLAAGLVAESDLNGF